MGEDVFEMGGLLRLQIRTSGPVWIYLLTLPHNAEARCTTTDNQVKSSRVEWGYATACGDDPDLPPRVASRALAVRMWLGRRRNRSQRGCDD